MTFKKGDTVRVKTSSSISRFANKIGTVEVAVSQNALYPIVVSFSDGTVRTSFRPEELELVLKSQTVRQAEIALDKANADLNRLNAELREASKARAKAHADLVQARAARPAEPPVGADVRFDVVFRHGDRSCTYIALHQSNGWTVTGKRNEGKIYTWGEVLDISERGVNSPKLQVRTA